MDFICVSCAQIKVCVYVLVFTFQFIVIERPTVFYTVLNTMWLYAVRPAGFVLKHHLDSVLLFSSQHWTCRHGWIQSHMLEM